MEANFGKMTRLGSSAVPEPESIGLLSLLFIRTPAPEPTTNNAGMKFRPNPCKSTIKGSQ